MRIGDRDVLAIGPQSCLSVLPGVEGIELIDISDPCHPQRLSVFELEDVDEVHGVHEFDLVHIPDGPLDYATPTEYEAAYWNQPRRSPATG